MFIKYVKAKVLGLLKTGEVKKCFHCGNLYLAKAKICPKCGKPFEKSKS